MNVILYLNNCFTVTFSFKKKSELEIVTDIFYCIIPQQFVFISNSHIPSTRELFL